MPMAAAPPPPVSTSRPQAEKKQQYFLDAWDDAEDPGACTNCTSRVPPAKKPMAQCAQAGQQVTDEEEEEEKEVTFEAGNLLPTSGQAGVDLAARLSEMRNQNQLARTTARQAAGRNCLKIRGVWVDDGFDRTLKTVAVKAMSAAYFRILERHPSMREVFRLGNRVVWVTPSRTALVIDTANGKETLTDAEIDALFVAPN
jgi:hypothetical protein